MPSELDDFKQTFYSALEDMSKLIKEHKDEMSLLFTELRKTVTAAISLLSDENLRFQGDIREKLAADAAERRPRQRRADRKDIAVLSAVGCLIVINTIGSCLVIVLLAVWTYRGGL